jgi:hypothetical protein
MNITVENSTIIKDGYEFFVRNLTDYLPYVILNAFGALFGSIGNIFVIGSIACTKELQTMTNLVIANLALAGFLLNTTSTTFAIAGLFRIGNKIYNLKHKIILFKVFLTVKNFLMQYTVFVHLLEYYVFQFA